MKKQLQFTELLFKKIIYFYNLHIYELILNERRKQ